jgi:hypothetical protein
MKTRTESRLGMARVLLILFTILLIAGASVGFSFVSRRNTLQRAQRAIERADEYWDAGSAGFDPRYLEAEKAVTEVGDVLDSANLRACLSLVKLSRETQALRESERIRHYDAISDGLSSKAIAERETLANDTGTVLDRLRGKAQTCIAAWHNH